MPASCRRQLGRTLLSVTPLCSAASLRASHTFFLPSLAQLGVLTANSNHGLDGLHNLLQLCSCAYTMWLVSLSFYIAALCLVCVLMHFGAIFDFSLLLQVRLLSKSMLGITNKMGV